MHARRHAPFAPVAVGLVLLVLLGLRVAPVPAADAGRACLPVVQDAWVRLPPARMPMLAGFARLQNACGRAATIVAARSPAFASVSLHETRQVDGISRMRAVPTLRLRPGARVALEPGGLHLMLSHPSRPLAAGDSVRIEFELEDGRSLHAAFELRAPGAL